MIVHNHQERAKIYINHHTEISMLFKYANYFLRTGHTYEAALIYSFLSKLHPDFTWYSKSKELSLSMLDKMPKGRPKLEWSGERQDSILLKTYDAVARCIPFVNDSIILAINDALGDNNQKYLTIANAYAKRDRDAWCNNVNTWLNNHNMRQIAYPNTNTSDIGIFNFLPKEKNHNEEVTGPLVSVFMSAYNAEKTIEYAIKSIQFQEYTNIEIIIINDNSSDNTQSIIEEIAANDYRIKVIKNIENNGTYKNRNIGLSIAKGKYFTVMDSDDYAHPQRISIQVHSLESNESLVACVGEWVRVTFDGTFIYRSAWGGGYEHEAVASLMIDIKSVVNKVGYYDQVRFGADSEYMHRIKCVFGDESLLKINKPLALAAAHTGSLTGNETTGVDIVYGMSPVRKCYQSAWKKWHKNGDNLFIDIDQKERPFPLPDMM